MIWEKYPDVAMNQNEIQLLEKAEIKPTSNRLLVLRTLLASKVPMSLLEIETSLQTLERSSISRVLGLFLKKDVIHAFEDGKGIAKYEICHGETHCSPDDMHAHFYCEKCERVYCFEEINTPKINIPPEFKVRSVNYMLKGLCPRCS